MGVSGHVNKPNTYELELGIPLRMLVENHCGGMRNGKKFKGAIAGGVSMGVLGTDQYDAPMDFDIGRKYDVLGLGTACPTIFDEDTDMVAVLRRLMTEEARRTLVTTVEKGSPADGKLEVGDVILGVFGQPFTTDARRTFGLAIGRAFIASTCARNRGNSGFT